jgi:hypothetical protein
MQPSQTILAEFAKIEIEEIEVGKSILGKQVMVNFSRIKDIALNFPKYKRRPTTMKQPVCA